MRFADDLDVLRERMTWDEPTFILAKVSAVLTAHHLNRTCPACHAAPGVMCQTNTNPPHDRAVIHTERTFAKDALNERSSNG